MLLCSDRTCGETYVAGNKISGVTGIQPLAIISLSTAPGPTDGSWSASPINTTCALFLTAPSKCPAKYTSSIGLKLATEQREAVKTALTNGLTVITGGPGTGKTMIQRAILDIYCRKHRAICLANTNSANAVWVR